jgi:hypothetical protein
MLQSIRPDVGILIYIDLFRLLTLFHFFFKQSPVVGIVSPSPLLSVSENVVQHLRQQQIGRAHPITKTEDLPSPLFENWKSARSLWKCYLLTVQCLPSPVE